MTDKQLLLAEAMGYIDDRFLEEAHPEAYGATQKAVERRKNIRRIAAVACLCVVAIGAFRISTTPGFGDKLSGNSYPEAAPPAADVGGLVTGDGHVPGATPPDGNTEDHETDSEAHVTEAVTSETETAT